MRHVRGRRRRAALVELHGADIGHDADHGEPRIGRLVREPKSPPERILARPERLRQLRVDQRDRRVAPQFVRVERPARDQPQIECLRPSAGDARVVHGRLAPFLDAGPRPRPAHPIRLDHRAARDPSRWPRARRQRVEARGDLVDGANRALPRRRRTFRRNRTAAS